MPVTNTIRYIGPSEETWTNPANWSSGQLPDARCGEEADLMGKTVSLGGSGPSPLEANGIDFPMPLAVRDSAGGGKLVLGNVAIAPLHHNESPWMERLDCRDVQVHLQGNVWIYCGKWDVLFCDGGGDNRFCGGWINKVHLAESPRNHINLTSDGSQGLIGIVQIDGGGGYNVFESGLVDMVTVDDGDGNDEFRGCVIRLLQLNNGTNTYRYRVTGGHIHNLCGGVPNGAELRLEAGLVEVLSVTGDRDGVKFLGADVLHKFCNGGPW